MTRILVAGIGNIFNGDDAFGVETARLLARRSQPDGVKVVDFGIRGIDLTYALLDRWDLVILVDAAERGESPGTVSVIEPQLGADDLAPEALFISAHDLDPAKVLKAVRALGEGCGRIVLVACEPLDLGGEEGRMGLSPEVSAAVEPAARTVEALISKALHGHPAEAA